jgi:hypothetical protein
LVQPIDLQRHARAMINPPYAHALLLAEQGADFSFFGPE